MRMCRRILVLLSLALGAGATAQACASDETGDETVMIDGLQWSLTTNGSDIRWPDAIDYCEHLQRAGHADWRLPTMEELAALHDPNAADSRRIRGPFELDTCCLWSGESLVDRPAEGDSETAGPPDRYHWGLILDGAIEYYSVSSYADGRALCVRNAGQAAPLTPDSRYQ